MKGHAAEGRRVTSGCAPGLTMQRDTHPLNDPESPRYGPASPRDEVRKRPAGIKPGRPSSESATERRLARKGAGPGQAGGSLWRTTL